MYNSSSKPVMAEKVIATASYLTAGIIGFIWFCIALITKNNLRPFLKFHVYQSVFLAIIYCLVSSLISLILGILSYIPIIKNIVNIFAFMFTVPIIFHFSLLNIAILALLTYIIVGIFQDKCSYIPWVSDVAKYNVERY